MESSNFNGSEALPNLPHFQQYWKKTKFLHLTTKNLLAHSISSTVPFQVPWWWVDLDRCLCVCSNFLYRRGTLRLEDPNIYNRQKTCLSLAPGGAIMNFLRLFAMQISWKLQHYRKNFNQHFPVKRLTKDHLCKWLLWGINKNYSCLCLILSLCMSIRYIIC